MSSYIEEGIPKIKPCLNCRGFPGCDEYGCVELERWEKAQRQKATQQAENTHTE